MISMVGLPLYLGDLLIYTINAMKPNHALTSFGWTVSLTNLLIKRPEIGI